MQGLPARIIRRRVDPEVEQALTRIAWWNWSHEQIKDTFADFRKLDASPQISHAICIYTLITG
jgi:hypothetical protein